MRTCTLLTLALAACLTASAGEKKMMHCFAFTVIETATDAEWKAFGAATDALPSKIPSITKVWHGKLRSTLNLFNPDAESRKKLMAGDPKATGDITRLQRKHGVCMEMEGPDSLKAYVDHPFHKEWMAAYEKVRVAGTTTIDILGQ